ncbi:MAG TPA: response regulator, partial [Vicinamibacteria bacterium]|nr:response regulator [Vicinamibacteria bacterium]
GAEGVRRAREDRPDLVLMDLAMPVMDGLSAAKEIKEDPATSAIPVVALTAHAMSGDEERAREAGFDDYLTKPVDQAALDRVLASAARARNGRAARAEETPSRDAT